MINKGIQKRIEEIKWMENCGKNVCLNINIKYTQVDNLEEAYKKLKMVEWENTTLEARNELTSFLYIHDEDKYAQWNDIALEIRDYLKNNVVTKLEKKQKELGLGDIFTQTVRWDIQSAMMEYEYRESKHNLTFFDNLLAVYEAGHLPCGWVGKYPNGALLIY